MNKCDICGKNLHRQDCKIDIGLKSYCGPETNSCYVIARRSLGWTLSSADAEALLDDLFDEGVA